MPRRVRSNYVYEPTAGTCFASTDCRGQRRLNTALGLMTADRSIELLQKHAHLLTPDKQAIARYICDNWPLDRRLPKGVAEHARRAYGRSVISLPDAQGIARDLFLEAARLVHSSDKAEA